MNLCVLDLELVSQFCDIFAGVGGVSLYLAFVLLHHYIFQLQSSHPLTTRTHFAPLNGLTAERTVDKGELFLETRLAYEVLLHADHHWSMSIVGEELDADRAFFVSLGDHQQFAQLHAGKLTDV